MRWFSPLLASLALVLVAGAPEAAVAVTRDTLDSDVSTGSTTTGCRGNKIQATVDTVLENFETYLGNTSGQTLDWYVYESTTSGGVYAQIGHAQTTGNTTSANWQNSGNLFTPIKEGRFYVLMGCWASTSPSVSYRFYNGPDPEDPSWGTFENGIGLGPYPGASTTFGFNSYDVRMRTNTEPGDALDPGDPWASNGLLSNFVRGNVFTVEEDALLRQVVQRAEVTASGGTFGTYSVPWYLYMCPGTCGTGASYTQIGSASSFGLAASGSTFDTWLSWTPNILLEAGNTYFVGIDHTSSGVGINKYYSSSITQQTSEFGTLVSHGSINIPSGTLPDPTDTVDLSTSTQAAQRIEAIRVDEESQLGSTTYTVNNTGEYGNIFQVDEPTHISEISFRLGTGAEGTFPVGIYQNSSIFGTYERIWSGEIEHTASTTWWASQEVDLDLDPSSVGANAYYLFVVEADASGSIYGSTGAGTSWTLGNHIGRVGISNSAQGMSAQLNVSTYASAYYDWNIVSCQACVDLDGDGVEVGDGLVGTDDDCDDTNATVYPGAVEVCDGLDNDCDGVIPPDELDSDNDGVRVCQGDCDDTESATYPGALEICDAEDNNCNGTIPTNELDDDGDGFVTCSYVGNLGGAILGGDDCDDGNATESPGTVEEFCDGDDLNCDGYDQLAYAPPAGNNSSSTGNVLVGNIYTFANPFVFQGVAMEMEVIGGATDLTFLVYEESGGTYTKIWSTSTSSVANGSPQWIDSGVGSIGLELSAGVEYLIAVHSTGTVSYQFDSAPPTLPVNFSVGELQGGWGDIVASAPSTVTGVSPGSVTLDLRIYGASELDTDSDGYLACAECDDSEQTVFPNAPELCDGLDNDCNGAVPPDEFDGDGDGFRACNDCDDGEPVAYPGNPEVCDGIDNDCNGTVPTSENDADGDGFRICEGDCGDTQATVYPGATEICDNLDNDCDGSQLPTEVDDDGDGFDECNDGDCDDTLSGVFPGAAEACDGLDTNCDLNIPADEADADGDGERICAGDCDDTNPATYSTAAEICDGEDNDCNGSIPSTGAASEDDDDGDGQRVCAGDCGDTDSNVGAGFSEICDGKDSNCDGSTPATEVDNDADSYIDCVLSPLANLPPGIVGGGDCDDGALDVYPGAPELCDGATIDNDCDGTANDEGADVDGDGTNTCTDCDDADAAVYPGAPEICDGKNSDCAGGIPSNEQDPDGDGFIQCTLSAAGTPPAFVLGGEDCAISDPTTYPGAAELCDGIDNDCNGALPADEQDPDADGVLECDGDCGPTDPLTYPGATEQCDGADNDCNGTVPANESDSDSDGQRVCGGDCNDANNTIYTGAPALCDGRDNDCVGGLEALEVDADGDSFFTCTYVATGGNPSYGGGDCDDSLATFYPGAAELCDGLDGDCDGSIPLNEQDVDGDGVSDCEGDCDDDDPLRTPGATEVCDGIDNDCDGAIEAGGVDSDGDGVFVCDGDCNDGNNNVYPGNPEVCDGLDNDCANGVDDGFDVDGDGYFTNSGCQGAYSQLDCNDTDPSINPGEVEVCDGVDQDCDTAIDEDFDADGDGYRDEVACGAVWPASQVDCDDSAASVNPGATEVCNQVDDDCDTVPDDGFDVDGDGAFTGAVPACVTAYGAAAVDCDDTVATTYPGAPEACNQVDDDCDSSTDEDFDDDGDSYFDGLDAGCVSAYGAALVDCDDSEPLSYPLAPEICDGEDNDCDLSVDEDFDVDSDGYLDQSCATGDDCDDTDASINPTATETCDGVDQDCNGIIDDGFDADGDSTYDASDASCLATYGALADCDDSDATIYPGATEVCDQVDQDCDLDVDEDFDVDGDGAFDEQDAGCAGAYAAGQLDCDDAVPTTYPGAPEICNQVDDDCDSPTEVDEGFDVDGDGFVDGANADCVAAYAQVDCDDAVATTYPGAAELCNDVDDDCDGVVPAIEIDNDGDGFDECGDGDCDDTNSSVFAGAFELCNGVDDNCSSVIDEPYDSDGDGFVDGANAGCVAAYGAAGVDCDDAVAAVNPSAVEVCDGIDNDCVGGIDDPFDLDGDSYFEAVACLGQYAQLDCDDTLAAVNPGQSEDCSNGIDDDCDGSADIGFDVDGDGVDTCNGDCNDNDPAVNPGAAEVCNAADDNCNQQIDEGFDGDADGVTSCGGDCDDADATVYTGATELCDGLDNDCDSNTDEDFDLDLDGAYDTAGPGCSNAWPSTQLDCNDANANVNPSATEVCNAVDDNCDGATDEGFDLDGDLAFDASVAGCAAAYGSGADCDDADPDTYPGATELCDGLDNDCNTVVPLDEVDNDVDGYVECTPLPNHVGSPTGGGDCADGNAAINPGATELCNILDDDCDGSVDEDFDLDGDGAVDDSIAACEAVYPVDDLDCDDTDPLVAPNQPEICDAVDNDCNGLVDDGFDADGDGVFDGDDPDCVQAWTLVDCDDANPNVFPGNVEDCTNGIDDNCNDQIDEDIDLDGDGYTTCGGDCDDDDASVNPGQVEICDGIDQNCDFVADEIFDGDGDGFVEEAACAGVYPADQLDCNDAAAAVNPDAPEVCDSLDNDCDGGVDENFDLDEDGAFDRFDAGCVGAYGVANTDCDDADPTVNPTAAEVCDGIDNNCNVVADEGFDVDMDGVWVDDAGCLATYGGPLDCDDTDNTVYPAFDDGTGNPIEAAPELCDGVDNDCDGVIPEDADVDGFFDAENGACTGDDLDCDDSDALVNPGEDEICDDTIDNDCDAFVDLDDPDCVEGDDDDSGDDDDATGDDDDATEEPPVLDPEYDGDRPGLAGGCSSCLGDVQGGGGSGSGALLFAGLLMALGLRRRRSGGRGALLLLVAALGVGIAAPTPAFAQLEQEAERQLDFAWKELEAEKWEGAIASAESALRLNPALYTAMVVKALAYEGMGELRKAESWLQTYLELTESLSQAPEAMDLANRLRNQLGSAKQVKAEATVTVGKKRTAFGDGGVIIGGIFGGRDYSQAPCGAGEGCPEGVETRPGFWATDGSGFGGGLSVRAEYFFGGWMIGARVRYDLGAGEPVGTYGIGSHDKPGHRLDAGVVFRPQLVGGLVSVRLMADVTYGMRTWTVYETVSSGSTDTAASFALVAHQLGGGIGVRVEPWQVIGFDLRYGVAGLLGGAGGVNDHSVEVGLGIRPVKPLLVRAGFDMHLGTLVVESEREGTAHQAMVSNTRAGFFLGAGVVF